MKARYLDVCARVVDVYTPERLDHYINKTRAEGVTEHGFPRLCANIGILIAHGRMQKLKHRFEEMIEICCRDMPVCGKGLGTRGNDFSVRELLSCILELEEARLYPPETISRWKAAMAAIDPKTCYRTVAPVPPVAVDNWGAFNAASEQVRCSAGLANTQDYIENQIASQMLSFDENGMYRDPNDPMVYDVVTRDMLSTCLHYGYNGSHVDKLNEHLRKAGKLMLLMQSVTGELAYGGRSSQFLHNEAHLAVCLEYEASVHKKLGDMATASSLKAAANLALDCIEHWLDIAPGQHIKNYYPNNSRIGCEKYAYYDKYMVTIASFLYLAYRFCDDTIAASSCPASDDSCHTWQSSDAFRKLFCKAGPYFVEAELRSDPNYDAAGIGRVHRRGAPSAICLSVPVSVRPKYCTGFDNDAPLSICCGKEADGHWLYGFDNDSSFAVLSHRASSECAIAELICTLSNGEQLKQTVKVSRDGVDIELTGDGLIGLTLPVFDFDGAARTSIDLCGKALMVNYKGWQCRYSTNGNIRDLQLASTNRNGVYRIFRAQANDRLILHISIYPNI